MRTGGREAWRVEIDLLEAGVGYHSVGDGLLVDPLLALERALALVLDVVLLPEEGHVVVLQTRAPLPTPHSPLSTHCPCIEQSRADLHEGQDAGGGEPGAAEEALVEVRVLGEHPDLDAATGLPTQHPPFLDWQA